MTTYQLSGEQLETLLGQAWDRGWAARHASAGLAIGGAQRYAVKELASLTPAPEPAGDLQKRAEEAAREQFGMMPDGYARDRPLDWWERDALDEPLRLIAQSCPEVVRQFQQWYVTEVRRLLGEEGERGS